MAIDGISDIFRVLGSPQRRTMLTASGSLRTNRTIWPRGCVAENVDAHETALRWDRCVAHLLLQLPLADRTV